MIARLAVQVSVPWGRRCPHAVLYMYVLNLASKVSPVKHPWQTQADSDPKLAAIKLARENSNPNWHTLAPLAGSVRVCVCTLL